MPSEFEFEFEPQDVTYKDWSRNSYAWSLVLFFPLFIASTGLAIWLLIAPIVIGYTWWGVIGTIIFGIISLALYDPVGRAYEALTTDLQELQGKVRGRHVKEPTPGWGSDEAPTYYYFTVGNTRFESSAIYPHIRDGRDVTVRYWAPNSVASVTVHRKQSPRSEPTD